MTMLLCITLSQSQALMGVMSLQRRRSFDSRGSTLLPIIDSVAIPLIPPSTATARTGKTTRLLATVERLRSIVQRGCITVKIGRPIAPHHHRDESQPAPRVDCTSTTTNLALWWTWVSRLQMDASSTPPESVLTTFIIHHR